MPRYLDLECACGAEVTDLFVMTVPSRIVHLECGGEMEQVYRPRRPSSAQWDDHHAVVVFRRRDGSIVYPARNTKATPPDCERVVMRSLQEVQRFEREHNVVSHIAHFDSGSGRSYDDTPPSKLERTEHERYERFREYTRGVI